MTTTRTPPQEQHPFFVYGTLRPGEGNTWAWEDLARPEHDGVAILPRWKLATAHGGFPVVLPDADQDTIGTLIVAAPEGYDDVLANMDMLEGYPNLYDRLLLVVGTPSGHVKAWVYVPTEYQLAGRHFHDIAGNDWTRRWSS